MKKGFLTILIYLSCGIFAFSQTQKEITVLFLLPIHLDESAVDIATIETDFDIYEIPSFEMMGFWEGAKLALQTYEDSEHQVNVIVRDVTTDEKKLTEILKNYQLMKDVDLIIGPFYGSLFPIAAKYAEDHKITIINPFTSRTDFVSQNSSVYKLIPSLSSKAKTIHEKILSLSQNNHVVLWYDANDTVVMTAYENYFKEQNIPYSLAQVGQGSLVETLPLRSDKQNVVIALYNNQTHVINQMRLLSGIESSYPVTLIFPESWLNISSLDVDFYSLKNLFYFTNYFIENDNQSIVDYRFHYVETYQSPCQLERFSFQGYDITKYFIDLYFAGFNEKMVTYFPMSYKFKFKQWTKGGFENDKARLIQIQDFERKEVE
ncbi:MAG TPA: hypothetical protein PLI77_05685 [Bacteroidales bacterium]|nr:hypothetical protein [Bacteroidales bacterium]